MSAPALLRAPDVVPVPRHGRRMHVAVVTETYPPEVNGVARTIANMVDGLRSLGHRISLTRPRQHAREKPTEKPLYRETLAGGLPLPGYSGLRFGLPAGEHFIDDWTIDRPDVVQVVTEGPLGASAVGAARRLGIPVVSEFHTNFHAYSGHYGFGWLTRLIAWHMARVHGRADATLVPTAELATTLAAQGYRNLRVVARGIDTARFNPRRRSDELRARWGVAADAPVVAYVGRVAAEKNLPLVMAAFDAIAARVPAARLLIVGDGPAREALARRHPQHIFAGMRHSDDLAAHFASADLFLFPSLTETFGNVVIEALASGLPVVAYRTAAARELIRSGENGYAAAPRDEADFVRAAVALAAAPVASHDWRARIAASVAHLSWGAIHLALEGALREAIDGHGGASRRVAATAYLTPASGGELR